MMKKLLCAVAVVLCGTTVVGCSELADSVKEQHEWVEENNAYGGEVTYEIKNKEKNDTTSLRDDIIKLVEKNIGELSYSHEINYDEESDTLYITMSNEDVEYVIYTVNPDYNKYTKNQWKRKFVDTFLDLNITITNKFRENGFDTHVSLMVVDGCSDDHDPIMTFYDDSVEYSRY